MKVYNLIFLFFATVAFSLPLQDKDGKYFVKRGDKQVYIPNELKNNDFNNDASLWSFRRSKASQNIIVFWEQGFGADPGAVAPDLRFDVNDLLTKVEKFYAYYRNDLKFVAGPSKADTYKMSIWVKHQTQWLATGSGYDNVIGAIWVNPGTMHPVGGTIGHEIGHAFQYQVHCDGRYGFRDQDYLGTYWEICAQWMSSRLHPDMFNNQQFELITNNPFKHPLHENFRYQSILFNEYWSEKHGIDIIGRIWNGAQNLEDPFETYRRITNINQAALNDEMFIVAQKNILFDYKHMGPILKRYRNQYNIKLQNNNDGTYQIPPDQCTQTYGYAPIPLEIPAGGKVTAKFTGITGNPAYHTLQDRLAGWRYGFVAVTGNGDTSVFSKPFVGTTQTSSGSFDIPAGTRELWFIAMGAPTEHIKHHWKEGDNSRDEHFPWKVAFSTCIRGQRCNPGIPVDNASAPAPVNNPAPANTNPAPQANPAPVNNPAPAAQPAPVNNPAPQPAPVNNPAPQPIPVNNPAPQPAPANNRNPIFNPININNEPKSSGNILERIFGGRKNSNDNFRSTFPWLD